MNQLARDPRAICCVATYRDTNSKQVLRINRVYTAGFETHVGRRTTINFFWGHAAHLARFETLLPAFSKLGRHHRRYPELARFGLWYSYRLFVLCGTVATVVTVALDRARLLFSSFWVAVVQTTTWVSGMLFGHALLRRRGLPLTGRKSGQIQLDG